MTHGVRLLDLSTGGGVERSLRELSFQGNDKVPVVSGFICKASLLERIAGMGPFWDNPKGVAIEAYRRLGTDLVMQLVLPKQQDVMTSSVRPTNFTQKEKPPYDSPEDVIEEISTLPSLREVHQDFDAKACEREIVRIAVEGQRDMGDMLWVPYSGGSSCAFMWYSRFGFRPYLLAIMRYPDAVETLFRNSGEEAMLRNRALTAAVRKNGLPPYVYFGEDICYNHGPMVPVSILREIYFPYLKRALVPLKDADIKIIWHSDGNILPITEDLLECGVDGFQGFQQETGPTLEHFAGLRSRAGRKLILWGSISVTQTLPFGTPRDVEREVEACIDAAQDGGGYFVAPSSSVGPEVPDENIIAMHRHAIEYGSKVRG